MLDQADPEGTGASQVQRDGRGADGSIAPLAIGGTPGKLLHRSEDRASVLPPPSSLDVASDSHNSQRDTSFKIIRSTASALTPEMVQAMIGIESEHRRRGYARNGPSLAYIITSQPRLRACLAYQLDATGSTVYLGFALARVGVASYLWELHVFATHWKLGIGRQLLHTMIGDGACDLQVHTKNIVARRFYEMNGFKMQTIDQSNPGIVPYAREAVWLDAASLHGPMDPPPRMDRPPPSLSSFSRLNRIPNSIEQSNTSSNSDLAMNFSRQTDSSAPLRGPARYDATSRAREAVIPVRDVPDRMRPMSRRPNLAGYSPAWRPRMTPTESDASYSDYSERASRNVSPACSHDSFTGAGFETLDNLQSLPLDFSPLLPPQGSRSFSVASSSASNQKIRPYRITAPDQPMSGGASYGKRKTTIDPTNSSSSPFSNSNMPSSSPFSNSNMPSSSSISNSNMPSSSPFSNSNMPSLSPISNSNMPSSSSATGPQLHPSLGPMNTGPASTNRAIPAATGRPRSASAPTSRPGTEKHSEGKPTKKRESTSEQRDAKNLYRTDFFYPSGVAESCDDDSCELASKWDCSKCYGCAGPGCLQHLSALQIYKTRTAFQSANLKNTLEDGMASRMATMYDQTTREWGKLVVQTGSYESTHVCVTAFGLLCGVSSRTLRGAMDKVRNGDVGKQFVPAADPRLQITLDYKMIEAYVRHLVNHSGECNPAPGAHQDGRTTYVVKQTWAEKWKALEIYFKDASYIPGSKSMLKRVWGREKKLKERRANSHSKCDTCSKIDKQMFDLVGQTSVKSVADRKRYLILKREHDVQHLRGRMELDDAGLMATVNPRYMWTVMVDAATQKNFELPKGGFRTPKELAGKPYWSYKLMAVFAYGFGFMPYLIHNSQTMGANLTWTVLWLALCKMRTERGYWPQVHECNQH